MKRKKALLISCFDWYEKRLKAIEDMLKDSYAVTVVTSDFDHVRKEPVRDRRDGSVYVHVTPYEKNLSAARIRSHLQFGKSVGRYLAVMKPDLIYLLLPPNNTAKYCAEYKKKNPSCVFLIDLIDLWPESMPIGKFGRTFPAHIWAGLRNQNLSAADHIFTECALYRQLLKNEIPQGKSSVLYLSKSMREEEKELLAGMLSERAAERKELQLCYLGSVNHIVDIDGICGIVSALQKKVPVRFVLIGAGESRDRFAGALREAGAAVSDYGAVYDEMEKIRILAACDFAFNMMNENVKVGLTIKSIDYLSYGLPLINNIRGDTWKLVSRYRIGVNAGDDPAETAAGILRYQREDAPEAPRRIRDLFEKNFSGEAFCRKFGEVRQCIEEKAGTAEGNAAGV